MNNITTEFDIEKIVNYLNKYKNNLETQYTWDVPTLPDTLNIAKSDNQKLNAEPNNFKKNIILKQILHRNLLYAKDLDFDYFKKLCLWIIEKWGNINTHRDKNLSELIRSLYLNETISFDRIASRSKIRSLLDPENYIIYDSRVAYSINWILLITKGKLFFPIPSGRNHRMSAFEMNVLIRLINSNNYRQESRFNKKKDKHISNRDKELFLNKNIAYEKLNLLIKEISLKLWDDVERQKNLFYTEMLLFAIADTIVFNDIIDRVEITLKHID